MKNPFGKSEEAVSADELIRELENEMKGKTIRPEIANLILRFVKNDAPHATAAGVIWEVDRRTPEGLKEVYFQLVDFSQADAILATDQWHHRLQHTRIEELNRYD